MSGQVHKGLTSFGAAVPPTRSAMAAGQGISHLKSATAAPASLLAYGNGRSYGDTCQAAEGGSLIDMRAMGRILAFDPRTGMMEAEAGVLLDDVIARAAPHGYFPAVVPGTRFVTLGGAIANDVHGKNHHRRGTFGCHVESFVLLRSDGRSYRCSRERNAHLFHATIGGMGLTGLILSAQIRLMRTPSIDVIETATPFSSLEGYFELAEEADRANEYAVAWIDQLAGGAAAGRGVLLAGNHAEDGGTIAGGGSGLAIPVQPPFIVLGRPFITAFNAAYRWAKSRKRAPHRTSWQSFFFPLDGVRDWNRLYGPAGLHQHQSVIPDEAARIAVPRLLAAARAHGQASFLTVLKRFGTVASPGILSFPRPGYTLTLDFANRGRTTLDLLDELDAITVDAGGAVNPYKDARMAADTFKASFPAWEALEAQRDRAFASRFWARTALSSPDGMTEMACAAE